MSVVTRLHVRVAPGAATTHVVGRHGAGWKVRVNAPPEGGRANDAVVRLLAEALALPARDIDIVSGRAARDKTVTVSGIDSNETERRLARACREREDGA